MSADELYKKGQLPEAIDAQIAVVKTKPADSKARLFLFELLAFAGELDRAQKQIEALKFDEPELQMAAAEYRTLVDTERTRRRVFTEGVLPEMLGEPTEHLALRLQALQQLRGGDAAGAAELLGRAEAAVPALKGTLNDKPFELIRDCDDLFGPVLEVMARGKYLWVPMEQVSGVACNPPKFPRDLLWFPAKLQMRDGQEGDVFLPAVYINSHASPDPQARLGRLSDWLTPSGAGPVRGIGARMFLVGDDALPLLDWKQLTFAD